MHALLKLDGNYGWIVSRHRTAAAAREAYDRAARRSPQKSLVRLMYRVIELSDGAKAGDRIRHS